jgi:hypothetical protein
MAKGLGAFLVDVVVYLRPHLPDDHRSLQKGSSSEARNPRDHPY